MPTLIEKLQAALERGQRARPKVGGFPWLAEALRQAGVTRNLWTLPAAESLYVLDGGAIVSQGTPLESRTALVPAFDQQALIAAIRADQAGQTTFPEFLQAAWQAGVVRYDVDLEGRTVSYYGYREERYVESYPAVRL